MNKRNASDMRQKPLTARELREKTTIENGKRRTEKVNKENRKREQAAKRKREERARYSGKGLITVSVRVKPSDKEALLQYVEGLNKNDNS